MNTCEVNAVRFFLRNPRWQTIARDTLTERTIESLVDKGYLERGDYGGQYRTTGKDLTPNDTFSSKEKIHALHSALENLYARCLEAEEQNLPPTLVGGSAEYAETRHLLRIINPK